MINYIILILYNFKTMKIIIIFSLLFVMTFTTISNQMKSKNTLKGPCNSKRGIGVNCEWENERKKARKEYLDIQKQIASLNAILENKKQNIEESEKKEIEAKKALLNNAADELNLKFDFIMANKNKINKD